MQYFVTGLTGFIGNEFLECLCKREGTIYALVREGSLDTIRELRHRHKLTQEQLVAVVGDLGKSLCGVEQGVIDSLRGQDVHVYHLGAIYSLTADSESQRQANITGTREAVRLAEALQAGCFHHVSSIVAGGFFEGVFTEDMFEEAVDVDKNAYFHTKHLAEAVVRQECTIPWRVYRPGAVVGNTRTGWINKIDGPYYFFNIINKIAEVVPRWVPLPVYRGNPLNLVPVDFVASALDHIGHQPGHDGKCFHLTDPNPLSLGEVINEFLKAAEGPAMKWDVPLERLKDFLPEGAQAMADNQAVLERVKAQLLENLDVPAEVLLTEQLKTHYDCSNTLQALAGSGIAVPPLKAYAQRLWHYWEYNLNPAALRPHSLVEAVGGQTVLITGGSEGIGKAVAHSCAEAGAKLILVARTQEKLDLAVAELQGTGADAHSYSCDLSNLEDCDRVVDDILRDHGHVDVLVNNAGRSIRRSLSLTYGRFHDFERVMQINYYSAVRLAMRLLPYMVERRQGHVVNISSIVALSKGTPRFSSYVASKSAMDAWSNSAGVEYRQHNIAFTNVHMPLVRTRMIEATTSYNNVQVLTTEEAADMVADAIVHRPVEVNTLPGELGRLLSLVAPDLYKLLFATAYQLTDDSAAARAASPPTVADQAMGALQDLNLDAQTLESISRLLKGYHT